MYKITHVGRRAVDSTATDVDVHEDLETYDWLVTTAQRRIHDREWKVVENLAELKGNLCIYRHCLVITHACTLSCGCQPNPLLQYTCDKHKEAVVYLLMRKICSMTQTYPRCSDAEDASHPDHQDLLYSFGYVFDYIKTCNALNSMKGTPDVGRSTMLKYICSPLDGVRAGDHLFPLTSADKRFMKEDAISLVPAQRHVVDNLQHALELIHGPPGTGKSTCIRAIVRERVPPGDVVLLTAVQNKAVDVLVRMFHPYVTVNGPESEVDMMVVGAVATPNMGEYARCFTLESLISLNTGVQALMKKYDEFKGSDTGKRQIMEDLLTLRTSVSERLQGRVRVVLCTLTEVHKLKNSPRFKLLRDR